MQLLTTQLFCILLPLYFPFNLHIFLSKRDFLFCRFLSFLPTFLILCHFQAFEITSNVPESLDNLLADSLNKRMPLSRLQVFGITQIAEEDTTGSKRFYSLKMF